MISYGHYLKCVVSYRRNTIKWTLFKKYSILLKIKSEMCLSIYGERVLSTGINKEL